MRLLPGWVETDLGLRIEDYWAKHNPNLKPIAVQQSVENTLRVIEGVKLEEKIRFYTHTGAELPW